MLNKFIFFLFASILPFFSYAQEIKVSGYVIDTHTKEAIIGVNIYNSSKTIGTSTNLEGKFSISINSGETIFFSVLGYVTYSKTFKNTSKEINIQLKSTNVQLDEVTVRARPNINDIDIRKATSSISNIKVKRITNRPSVNVVEALQGQVAGVVVTTSGELGSTPKIRIRGSSTLPIKTPPLPRSQRGILDESFEQLDNRANQPLFVLDGQVISPEAFETLNVNDIESIKILKDAAANALYGIKAANGVIEITGKRGINGKTQYSFSMQQGITLKGDPAVAMMRTEEKLRLERIAKNVNTPGYNLSEEFIRSQFTGAPDLSFRIAEGQRKLDSLKRINTNWFKELARINTFQSYNLGMRGGNTTNKFYLSGNFTKQGGKYNGNIIHRFTGRFNYEYSISNKTSLMLNSSFGLSESKTPHGSNFSPTSLIYQLNPYEQKDKGKLVSYSGRTFNDLVNQFEQTDTDNRFSFSGNLYHKFNNDLDISAIVGIDYLFSNSLSITPRTAFVFFGTPENAKGSATKIKVNRFNFNYNTRINYRKTFSDHTVLASVNMDFYKTNNDFAAISGFGLPSKLNSAAGINNDLTYNYRSTTDSRKVKEAQLGFGSSLSYNWKDLFEIYGSYKADASSLLPSNKRWNSFWATGVAYNLGTHNFLERVNWIKSLKLRVTYGVTASLAGISASLVVPTFTYSTQAYLGFRDFSLKDLFNEGLRPEKNTSINLGLDITLFKNTAISLEVYRRKTDDLLLTVPVSPSTGFRTQLKNVGALENKGIELTLSTPLLNTKDFSWNSSINMGYNENKVLDLFDGNELFLSNNPFPDYKVGESSDLLYGLVDLGVLPADGIRRYRKADGTEATEGTYPKRGDFVVLGKSTPPVNGGWFHTFNYKNLSLSFDFYYSLGGIAQFTNQSVAQRTEDVNRNAVRGQLENTWLQPGDEGKLYSSLFVQNKITHATTRTVGKTDFIRLNNIQLRYRVNQSYLAKISKSAIKNWNVYLQLKNIATWSNFGGGDPESANLVGAVQPIITFGTNLSF